MAALRRVARGRLRRAGDVRPSLGAGPGPDRRRRDGLVFVSGAPRSGVGPLDAGLDVTYHEHDSARPHELLAGLAADALLCMLTERIDAELLDAAPNLRIVANLAVGFDNVDVAAATERGSW